MTLKNRSPLQWALLGAAGQVPSDQALEKIDPELAEQVNHVHEDPILDIPVVLELPEVQSVEFDRLVCRRRVEVVAGMRCLDSCPTRTDWFRISMP